MAFNYMKTMKKACSVNDQLPTKFCAGGYNPFTWNHTNFILATNERPSFQLRFNPILIPILCSNTSFHCALVRHVNDQLSRTDTSFRPRIYFPLNHYGLWWPAMFAQSQTNRHFAHTLVVTSS